MTVRHRFLTKRVLAWGAPLAVIAILIGLALVPPRLPVDLAVARRLPLEVTIDEDGETRVRERFVVSAPVSGRLLRVELEPGDPVVAGGTVLATLLPASSPPLDTRSRADAEARVEAAKASLQRAQADRARAEAERDFAAAELARRRRLAAESVLSQGELEQAVRDARSLDESARAAGFAVDNAVHELERAQGMALLTTGRTSSPEGRQDVLEVRSPGSGTVLRRLVESETVVAAGQTLLELGDPADLEVVADLLSADAVRIAPGQRVVIERWGGDRPLAGVVHRVEPYGFTKISALGVEEQRVNVRIDLTDPRQTWEALGDGYRVEVRIVVWEADEALVVPTSCLFRHGDDWATWVVEGARAGLRLVEMGERNGTEAQVLSGLAEGDTVIVHPSEGIEDGARVEARR